MTAKQLDTQVRREIYEFNREFLTLILERDRSHSAYGLDTPVSERLRQLSGQQLQDLAEMPCLLAAFGLLPPRSDTFHPSAGGVADSPALPAAVRSESARLFAASLLGWLWHTTRRDRLVAALCIGPGRLGSRMLGLDELRGAAFRDLQRTALADCLEARFCRHPRLWPDLVRAVCDTDPQVLTATRLSFVQLTLVSRG